MAELCLFIESVISCMYLNNAWESIKKNDVIHQVLTPPPYQQQQQKNNDAEENDKK